MTLHVVLVEILLWMPPKNVNVLKETLITDKMTVKFVYLLVKFVKILKNV